MAVIEAMRPIIGRGVHQVGDVLAGLLQRSIVGIGVGHRHRECAPLFQLNADIENDIALRIYYIVRPYKVKRPHQLSWSPQHPVKKQTFAIHFNPQHRHGPVRFDRGLWKDEECPPG